MVPVQAGRDHTIPGGVPFHPDRSGSGRLGIGGNSRRIVTPVLFMRPAGHLFLGGRDHDRGNGVGHRVASAGPDGIQSVWLSGIFAPV